MLSLFKTDKSQKIIKKSSIAILIVFLFYPLFLSLITQDYLVELLDL